MGFIEDKRFLKYGARCIFFDRLGGVSPAPFDSLNFSVTVGDNPENVKRNFKLTKVILKAKEISTVNQVHSNRVIEYDGKKHKADGIYTFKTGIFLGVKIADCVPIILLDTKTELIAAIHAGWRGSYLGISKKAIEIFIKKGSKPKNIIACLGPHICENCYEIGKEVASRFNREFLKINNNKIFLNLSKVNISQLIHSGVPEENIIDLNICTYENKSFFSYRRDKICGRNIGGVIKTL